MPKHFYLTTTLPYVNAEPHIGFAMEIIAADVICRAHSLAGESVVFNTGTDEHGQKIYQNAIDASTSPQAYCDEYAAKFAVLKDLLSLTYTNFIRTTDAHHIAAAQEFWKLCKARGDIYKKQYSTQYCVGCELEKQASDLVEGRCPLHPNKKLEVRDEENYFFRFSSYQKQLLTLYESNPEFVLPEGKQKEIHSFVQGGLQDFSISRLKEKMPWGISVPDDADHVMYVWFDALINYISTIGWPTDKAQFEKSWPVVQIAGKDNLRQQAAMWQAMLLSAGVSPSQTILINGFISVDGQKMSKSLGNVIAPTELVETFGTEATRYLLMQLGPIGTDMDVSWDKFRNTYNADLSNGYGNLCSRIAKLWAMSEPKSGTNLNTVSTIAHSQSYFYNYNIKRGIDSWKTNLSELDGYLSTTTPWKKTGSERQKILKEALNRLLVLTHTILPVLPKTAATVINHFEKSPHTPLAPLFPRIS